MILVFCGPRLPRLIIHAMFLKAGALSLALLLVSRLLGLVRESAQAAAFGTSGLADVVVLMLALPDWLAGVLASGALAYVLVPTWAGQSHGYVAATQRRVAWALLGAGGLLALLLALWRQPLASWLAAGLPAEMLPGATQALVWSAVALPAALLAALWTTRLQHERDFTGMYSANLVVNGVLIAAIISAGARTPVSETVSWLGAGLVAAMLLRLAWLRWRTPQAASSQPPSRQPATLPGPSVWLWAALSAGLPLALPFAARSIASQSGEGALATFNYAWKLVELPLVLAIQLVAALAFPSIARATASGDSASTRTALRGAFSLAWALACAAAAALLVGAPAIARLLFGWGRMQPEALAQVAQWGAIGAWGLLPQAVIAVSLAALAARGGMKPAVWAYGLALALLLSYATWGGGKDGARLMMLLNFLQAAIAMVAAAALGSKVRSWLPWRSMAISLLCLLGLAGVAAQALPIFLDLWTGLALAASAGIVVVAATWLGSADLRGALAR
jgi:putative peptidoglycan lipid II flippase